MSEPRGAGVVVPRRPRWQGALVPLACGALSLWQWWPVFREPGSTGFGDWQMIQHNWEAAYISLARFGQWPLWDAFHCGGISIFRNPESQVYSPFFPLSFAVGTVWAVKIMLWAHVALGLWGMYRLARDRYALRWLPSAVAAFAWGCSGCIVWDGAGGHATFLPFTFTPWVIWLVRSNRTLRRKAALIALLFVVTLYEGGTYPLPFFVLLLGFELALSALPPTKQRVRDAVLLGATVLALTALTGTLRILPSVLALREFPRQVPNDDAIDLDFLLVMLTAREHPWRTPDHTFVWAEYGSYMGWPMVILGAAGAVLAVIRGPRHLLAGLVVFGSLMLGNLGRFAPWSLLHELPVFDSLRVPTRFAMFFTLYVALLAAHAIDAVLALIEKWSGSRRWISQAALAVLALAAAAQLQDVVLTSRPAVELWVGAPLESSPPAERHHLVTGRYGLRYASYPRLNLGTPQCYAGAMNWKVSRSLWIGDKPQVRVHAGEGTVYEVRHTPSEWSADVEMKSAGRLWFNQNFGAGWKTNAGTIANDADLLAVDLPPGRHLVQLRYAPNELIWSVLLSALGFIAIGVIGFGRLPL